MVDCILDLKSLMSCFHHSTALCLVCPSRTACQRFLPLDTQLHCNTYNYKGHFHLTLSHHQLILIMYYFATVLLLATTCRWHLLILLAVLHHHGCSRILVVVVVPVVWKVKWPIEPSAGYLSWCREPLTCLLLEELWDSLYEPLYTCMGICTLENVLNTSMRMIFI